MPDLERLRSRIQPEPNGRYARRSMGSSDLTMGNSLEIVLGFQASGAKE
jgi:hypothetical protein